MSDSFDARLAEIEASIQKPEEVLRAIESLQFDIGQSALPRFDQERFAARIQKLKQQEWASQKPGRFQFKSKPRLHSGPEPEQTAVPPVHTTSDADVRPRSVRIIDDSVQKSVHLANLVDSVVVYPHISGPVYLENVVNSRVVVNSHQCRLKNCHDVEVWLERCPQPTIEACDGITFVIPLSSKKTLVNDFSWMQSEEANPNYTVNLMGADWNEKIDDVRSIRI